MVDVHKSIYDFMRSYREKHDDDIAVVHGARKMNYATLFKQVDRVAGGLVRLGVTKGDVVMIALPNILQAVVAVYACSRIGAIASMIHPKLSANEFLVAFKKLQPKVVFLSDINQCEYYPKSKGARRIICHFGLYDFLGLPLKADFEPFHGDGEEIAFYMQSGGTTGEPKTVAISSRAANAMVANLLQYLGDKFSQKNALLASLPMFHGFGLCVGVHLSLSTNMRSVLLPVFRAKKTVKVIAKNHITTMIAVPRMVQKLLALDEFSGDNISCIEDIYVGGDLVGEDLVKKFHARMEECGGKGVLSPGYGLTETASVCTVSNADFVSGSVGKPLLNVEVRVVDEDLKEVKRGTVGELLVAGEQIMSGYVGDEEGTKKALIHLDGKTWVRTGDYFKQDEAGRLLFMGRKKRLIKISGINVFPSEIERVAGELPFVGDCACIEYRIDGKPYIKLLVEGSLTDAQKQAVVNHISKNMSHWNKPREVQCVDKFPRTNIGKINIEGLNYEFGKDTQGGQ